MTVEQAQAIIQEFLTQLARCPVCDGSGTVTFGQSAAVDMTDTRGQPADRFIPAGTSGTCPYCDGKGDPEFVVWSCVHENDGQDCRPYKNGGSGGHEDHADCGYRITLPSTEVQA